VPTERGNQQPCYNYIVVLPVIPAMKKKKVFLVIIVCLLLCITVGCATPGSFESHLNDIIGSYRFSIARWEIEALSYEIEDFIFGGEDVTADDSPLVLEYFSLSQQIGDIEWQMEFGGLQADEIKALKEEMTALQAQKNGIEDSVEKVIEQQIRKTLAQMGIYNPLDSQLNLDISFPPVNFELEQPPHLLIVSPRESIERIKEIPLVQDITMEEREEIEAAIDELGVSSIVVGLGGMATYPSFVIDTAGLQFTINVAIEEWLHQYLFFRPLGFLYAMHLTGAFPNSDIAVMNETLVGIVRDEIGSVLYQKYYQPYLEEAAQAAALSQSEEEEFDFYKEMREIRLAVDDYLAQGEAEEAEAFMEEKRLFLASKGYYIRRLNQAYFAFYGTYAASPTSVNPIGTELKTLREQTDSLAEYLNTVAAMNNRQDLQKSIE